MHKSRWITLSAVLLATTASALFAEDIFVKRAGTVLREGPSSASPPVITLKKGEKGTVVERKPNFTKLSVGDKSGWTGVGFLTPEKPKGDITDLGSDEDAKASAGASLKGLSEDATKYANAKNLSPAEFNKMLAFQKGVTSTDLDAFEKAGKIGAYKPSK